MEQIDYACGIDCPDHFDDDQMLMEYVIDKDCELCYLDAYLKETLRENQESTESV